MRSWEDIREWKAMGMSTQNAKLMEHLHWDGLLFGYIWVSYLLKDSIKKVLKVIY